MEIRIISPVFYYVEKNKSLSGTYLVHSAGCPELPESHNRLFLGSFIKISRAVVIFSEYKKA
jgi:hypothetical protein